MEGSEEEMWKRGGERENGTVTEIETETGAETEIGTGDTEIETGAGTDTGGGGAGAVTDIGGAGAGTETVGKTWHLATVTWRLVTTVNFQTISVEVLV